MGRLPTPGPDRAATPDATEGPPGEPRRRGGQRDVRAPDPASAPMATTEPVVRIGQPPGGYSPNSEPLPASHRSHRHKRPRFNHHARRPIRPEPEARALPRGARPVVRARSRKVLVHQAIEGIDGREQIVPIRPGYTVAFGPYRISVDSR